MSIGIPSQKRARWERLAAAVIGLGTLAALLATSRDHGMVWDEGHTVRRERALAAWFNWLIDPPPRRTRLEAFSSHNLQVHWPFSREEPDGHPPFYALLGLAGWALARGLTDPLTAHRFGPMVLTAATTAIAFVHLRRRFGWTAGWTAAGAILCNPRVFSDAHYAHYDMPVSCLWLLAQVAFDRSLTSARWIVVYGILLGLAAGTKLTGWFAIAPAVAWCLVFERPGGLRRREAGEARARRLPPGVRSVALALPIAALTLVAIQPPWWSDPVRGVARFLRSNLSRYDTKPIPTLYLGQVYEFSLPWHNTLVLTAATVPVLLLLLAIGGLAGGLRARAFRPLTALWGLSWAVLMVVRALPAAPGHDGVRLFLPSIVSLAVLAGIGAGCLANLASGPRVRLLGCAIPMLALGEGVLGIRDLYPYTLSYYNVAVGGLPGAERHGFELTYYWDTMGPEFFDWVRAESRAGDLQLGFPTPIYNLVLLREWGAITGGVKVTGAGPVPLRPRYVLQRRRGLYFPYDDWIDRHGRPDFAVSRQGVDLLRVFPHADVLRAYEASRDLPVPDSLRRAERLHAGAAPAPPGG